MIRYLVFVLPFITFVTSALCPARADIAPDPVSGGWPISRFGQGTTNVRMVAEDVVVRIYADSILTVGSFSMHNDGATETMEVGFPFRYSNDLVRFRAFVDGRPAVVHDEQEGRSDRDGRKKWTVYWKRWEMRFPEQEDCQVRVEYVARPMKSSAYFAGPRRSSLPKDVLATLRAATAVHTVEYILETGKAWRGILDRCRISFELVGMGPDHIIGYQPENGARTENGVVWEYQDYEPSRWVNLQYSPYAPPNEIPGILRGVLAQFPDDARLASDLARFCGSYLARPDVEDEIYHTFLAGWDRPIPQLMEYAPGGRCRLDYEGGDGFFVAWQMANVLFKRYEREGTLERGRDIAPTVSRMSSAIVDSLDTCDGLVGIDFLYRDAKVLRDVCNKLAQSKSQ